MVYPGAALGALTDRRLHCLLQQWFTWASRRYCDDEEFILCARRLWQVDRHHFLLQESFSFLSLLLFAIEKYSVIVLVYFMLCLVYPCTYTKWLLVERYAFETRLRAESGRVWPSVFELLSINLKKKTSNRIVLIVNYIIPVYFCSTNLFSICVKLVVQQLVLNLTRNRYTIRNATWQICQSASTVIVAYVSEGWLWRVQSFIYS